LRLALLAMLLVACERGAKPETIDSAPAPVVAAVPAAPRPLCPATGQWAECSIFERLDRAGLAPRKDSAGAAEAPLTPKGLLLRVGNSELELYIYPDIPAREREEGRLDRTKYLEYPAPVGMTPLPTLIRSANLIAVLHSRNEHQRERVTDAITAGPPQPSRP
jgi:hypothetical protein